MFNGDRGPIFKMAALEGATVVCAIRALVTNSPEQSKISHHKDFDVLLSRNLVTLGKALRTDTRFVTLNAHLKDQKSPLVLLLKLEGVNEQECEASGIEKRDNNENDSEAKDVYTSRWKFVRVCLELLKLLKASLVAARNKNANVEKITNNTRTKAPVLQPDSLSVSDQKTIVACFQFVVSLGVCPNFLPGVGLPVEKRSGFGNLLQVKDDAIRKEIHLHDCVKVMVACIDQPALGALVLSRHLGDILAGLLQICHAPRFSYGIARAGKVDTIMLAAKTISAESSDHEEHEKKTDDKEPTKTSKDKLCKSQDNAQEVRITNPSEVLQSQKLGNVGITNNHGLEQSLNDDNIEIFISDRERDECSEILRRLLDKVYPPLVVRELLVLQGGTRRINTPTVKCSASKQDHETVEKPPVSKKEPQVKTKLHSTLNAAPRWLRKVCGQLLSERLMKSNGVQAVLRGVLELGPAASSDSPDWQKCDAVAKIIASCPSQAASVEDYYTQVCPQVVDLLHVAGSGLGRQFIRVATSTITLMLHQYPELADKYVFKPLMAPLLKVTEHSDSHNRDNLIVDEAALSRTVEDIHKVFVASSDAMNISVHNLACVIHPLFELFCFTRTGISHLRSAAQEILVQFLKRIDSAFAMKSLYTLAFRQHPSCEFGISGSSEDAIEQQNYTEIKLVSEDFEFTNGDTGGVVIVSRASGRRRASLGNEDVLGCLRGGGVIGHEVRALCLVELLMPLKMQGVAGEFFLHLMQELTDLISGSDETFHKKGDSECEQLSGGDETVGLEERSIVILNLLALMCEKLGPSILKSTQHMLIFIKATLERGCSLYQQEQYQVDPFITETLTMALGMLSAILGGAVQVEAKDRVSLQTLMPLLEILINQHPAIEVQEMANDLRIAVATHGAVWSHKMKDAAESLGKQRLLSEDDAAGKGSQNEKKSANKIEVQSEFDQAFGNLTDPLLPVRGFAMIRIAALLHAKDPKALQNTDSLLKIFQQQLTHDDSYIYLAAIKGLVALASTRTEEVISHLTREFSCLRVKSSQGQREAELKIKEKGLYKTAVEKDSPSVQITTRKQRSVELRLKLVEALVKITQECGEMLPRHSQPLITTLLSGVQDPEPLVRASCLSNLGDVCRLLRFTIGPIIHEVFQCLTSMLRSDKSEQARRAAAHVVTLLLKGLGKDTLEVLGSVLRELYHLLKTVESTDLDEVTRLHAQAALGELDTVMRDYLFPRPSFTKRIQVLP